MPYLGRVTLLLFPLLTFASTAPNLRKRALTTSANDVDGRTYDYIVVGGGLAGLTVAGRLAENPAVTVLVVEAGRDDRTDGRVHDMYRYGEAFGTDLMWGWGTDQGRGIIGGKTLGGSSTYSYE